MILGVSPPDPDNENHPLFQILKSNMIYNGTFIILHTRIKSKMLKVRKFQNENMKSSHCPKYERKNLKNSALGIQSNIFKFFVHILGNATTSYFHFDIYCKFQILKSNLICVALIKTPHRFIVRVPTKHQVTPFSGPNWVNRLGNNNI